MKSNALFLFFFFSSLSLSAQWTQLPDNMYADTLAYPYLFGVASGDPTDSSVMLWTKLAVDDVQFNPIGMTYKLAEDANMTSLLFEGQAPDASILNDWTVKVEATNLSPATHYYYQFEDQDGNLSQIGRTKTAPSDMSEELNFVVASCSSVYSGYFNAYRRIAERDEIDLVIHLGDYVYDFPDTDELVRIPEPYPIDPLYLEEWRQLHTYYLLDPDLRLMRQMHPIAAIWDNHDIHGNDASTTMQAMQAFHEYLPVRQQAEDLHLYRKLSYGDLVDIILMDAQLYRDVDLIEPGEYSILGNEQYDWLINEIDNSNATWRILGSQKLFGLWSLLGIDVDLPIGNDTVADPGSWDGYMLERELILSHLKDNGIKNNIFISGDLHMSLALDIPIYPLDSLDYNPETGEGSVGVEMMGGSITRGNADELGYSPAIISLMVGLSMSANPHHVYEELVKHGYGVLTIRPDQTIGRFWHSPILEMSDTESMNKELFCYLDSNHWTEDQEVNIEGMSKEAAYVGQPYPIPAKDWIQLPISLDRSQSVSLIIRTMGGKEVLKQALYCEADQPKVASLDMSDLAAGVYLLSVEGEGFEDSWRILKE